MADKKNIRKVTFTAVPGKTNPVKKEETSKSSKKSSETPEVSDEAVADLFGEMMGTKKPKKRPMLHFADAGLIMPPWALVTIELDTMFVERPKAGFKYGIVINRGMESSPGNPVGEKSVWYDTPELAKSKLDVIMEQMKALNYEFTTL